MATLIVGLGFMGGSLAAALTAAGEEVLLYHRRSEVTRAAADRGWGKALDELGDTQAERAVVCTPVSVIAAQVAVVAAAQPEAVITDVGSTKAQLCKDLGELARDGRFVGSHPMCGSHLQGLEHAHDDLYRGATVALTPAAGAPSAAIATITELWRSVGAHCVTMPPETHDEAVAYASHLPHVLASLAAGLADTDTALRLAASGFRDTTRVAAGSPALWCDILTENRAAILRALDRSTAALSELRAALEAGDEAAIKAWLKQGQQVRQTFERRTTE